QGAIEVRVRLHDADVIARLVVGDAFHEQLRLAPLRQRAPAAEAAGTGVVGDEHVRYPATVRAQMLGEDDGPDAHIDSWVGQSSGGEVPDTQLARDGLARPRHHLHQPDRARTALRLRVEE